jgi:hypothetical protein
MAASVLAYLLENCVWVIIRSGPGYVKAPGGADEIG